MNTKSCPFENSVIQATCSGAWNEELRVHASQCETCAEVETISALMTRIAGFWDSAEPLIDPGMIWLRAKWDERQRLSAKALGPAMIAQAAVIYAMPLLLLIADLVKWPTLQNRFMEFYIWMSNVPAVFSIHAVGQRMPYLTSPVFIFCCLAFAYYVLVPRLRRIFYSQSF